MRTTFAIKAYCRNSKADKSGKAPIELSISINGKRTFYRLPHPNVDPTEFNRKRRPKELQEYIDTITATINSIVLDMTKNGVPVTAAALKHFIQSGGFRSYTVGDMFDEFLAIQKSRIGIDLTEHAYRKFELVRDLFTETMALEREVTDITPSVIQSFYIKLQGLYASATAAGYITKLHTMVKFAMDNGHLKINPFQTLKVKRERKPIDYLSDKEIKAIMDAKIENKSLDAVRQAFLLQVFSGLAYTDLEKLKEEDIKIAADGTYYIEKPRVKTGVTYTAVILPEGRDILVRNNFKMKVISNQKMNLFLKEVGTLAGIEHRLVTHLGRKTYGHILLNRGVRLETTAKCLGHSNSRTTARYYAEVMNDTVINEVAAVFS